MDEITKLKAELFDLNLQYSYMREEIQKKLSRLNQLLKERNQGDGTVA